MTRSGRCDGWVRTLRNEVVIFTGRVLVDEQRVSQRQCGSFVEALQGEWRDEPSSRVTLVVHGDLAGQRVVDPRRQYSEKLILAQEARFGGRHVHVVDAAGFSDLLDRRPARCRRLRRAPGGGVEVLPEAGDFVFGEPFDRHQAPLPHKRVSRELARDLEALDRATAAHELTVRRLATVLAQEGVESHVAARRGPQFDLAWRRSRRLYIAEVKSLTGTDEPQQVRLGFGQVLDYRAQLAKRGVASKAVVVLERRPQFDRWHDLANATGVVIDWGPSFETLVRQMRALLRSPA